MAKTPEELFRERTKRVEDAVQLKVPDRVPVGPLFSYFYATYAGITPQEAHYDYAKWTAAVKKTVIDFEPDMVNNPRMVLLAPGPMLDMVDFKQIKWPGHGISPNHTFQFVEGEYMKAEEYDAFLEDPSDYVIRTYLPRIYGILEPFKKLPPIRIMMIGYGVSHLIAALAKPEMVSAIEALMKAAAEAQRWRSTMSSLEKELAALGFPLWAEAIALVPFDVIGDYLRGTRGVMLDMYRRPDKLLKAIEKVLPMVLQSGVFSAKVTGNPRVFIPLHKGAEGFMSLEQFKTFFWPTLRRLIIGLIDEGLTPWLFVEADYTSRLEIMRDIPKGKAIYHFERTDIFRAKEVLGDVICIRGGLPNSLLCTGTPQDVRDYCRKLIDVIGKGGGYIMDATALIDDAKLENMKAMMDFTKEYGVYG
jgi:uroporphyrinogen-III decarboxylase